MKFRFYPWPFGVSVRMRSLLWFAGLFLAMPTLIFAVPTPIIFDGEQWVIQSDDAPEFIGFESSGLTLEIRRFAQLPDPLPPTDRRFPPRPNMLTHAPGDDRLFVPCERGAIYVIAADGSSVTELFHVGEALSTLNNGESALAFFEGQGGLRSVAFHPDFNDPTQAGYGKLYTTQSVRRPPDVSELTYIGPAMPELIGTTNINRDDSLIAEWTATVDAAGRMTGVDLNSFREVGRVAIPAHQHPIKQLAFNPYATPDDSDYGLVYILQGDGTLTRGNEGTGQNGSMATGKVLRLNPLQHDHDSYSVPSTNPFIDDASVLSEIYTLGHRNPHAIAFALDALEQTQIFIAEVGEGSVEEINLLRAGGNYGWGEREGVFVRVNSQRVDPLPANESDYGYIFPVAQYGHGDRNMPHAIAGGYVTHNGSELDGYYFFGDFTIHDTPLLTFSIDDALDATLQGNPNELDPVAVRTVALIFDDDNDPNTPSIPVDSFRDIVASEPDYQGRRHNLRFGQGPNGEIYLLNKHNGWLYLVTNSVAVTPMP